MVMDEDGRNGGNWHLAQQFTQPVIRCILSQVATNHIPCNHAHSVDNNNYHTDMIWGGFLFLL